VTVRMIPYTHWAYFPDEVSAKACAKDLGDYVTRLRYIPDEQEWLLLAGRDVAIDDLPERHDAVQAIVERHGGLYDFGESTHDASTGEAVVDPMLTGEWGAASP
jgi:hypothetical protein